MINRIRSSSIDPLNCFGNILAVVASISQIDASWPKSRINKNAAATSAAAQAAA